MSCIKKFHIIVDSYKKPTNDSFEKISLAGFFEYFISSPVKNLYRIQASSLENSLRSLHQHLQRFF